MAKQQKKPAKTAAKAQTQKSIYAPYEAARPFFQPDPASMMDGVQKAASMFYKFEPQGMETFMNQGKTKFEKFSQEAGDIGRDNMEALIKSGGLFAKGFEELLRTSMSLVQDSAEKQAQFVKQAMGVKTLNEWADVQNRITQNTFDDFMSGATKISELSVKVLTESTEPLNKQINKTVQKATQAMAA